MKKTEKADSFDSYSREIIYATSSHGNDPKQPVEFVGGAVTNILGVSSRRFSTSPRSWVSLLHPRDRKNVIACWNRVVTSGQPESIEYRLKSNKLGKYVRVEDLVRARATSEGAIVGVAGSCVELAGSRWTGRAQSKEDREAPSPLEDMAVGYYRTTTDGKILEANRYLLDMLGFESFGEISRRNLNSEDYEPTYPRQRFLKELEQHGEIKGFENTWVRKDGFKIFVRENARAVRDESGRIGYIEGIVEDISERKKVEEKTARLNQLLRMLSAVNQMIMHEPGREELFEGVCETIVKTGKFNLSWIGLVDDWGKIITPLASGSAGDIDIDFTKMNIESGPEGNSTAARAVKDNAPAVCSDLESNRLDDLIRPNGGRHGILSSASFPMRVKGAVVGVLSVYSDKKDGFGEEEVRIISELADNIGFSLWAIEARQQQEAANEVIRDRSYWLNESQRVAKIGSYVYDVGIGTWSSSSVLDEILGIDHSYRRDFRSWLGLIHPDDRPVLIEKMREALRTRRRVDAEFRILVPSTGEVKWMWGSADFTLDPSGRLKRLFGTVQDISARKGTELALKQSESLFHASFENSSVGIALIGLDGKIRKSNRKLSEMMGYSREALQELKFTEVTFPEDVEAAGRVIEMALRGSGPRRAVEKRCVRKDGGIIWVQFSASLVRDPQGDPDYFVANFTDITERKRAEEDLKNEHILLRTVIDNLPNSIYAKDAEYKKTLANPANVRHAGKQHESEVLGKNDFELYPADVAAKYFADDEKVIKEGKSIFTTEEFTQDKDDKKKWQLTSKIPLRNKSGEIVGLVGIGTDITERKELEDAMKREGELLSAIIDLLPASVWLNDTNLRKTLVNRAHVERISSFTLHPIAGKRDIIGKTYFDLYPKEKAEQFSRDDLAVIESGTAVINREEMAIDNDGKKHWQLVSKVPLRDESGKVNGILDVVTDITRQKEAEESQKRERMMLRTIVDSIPHPIYVKDLHYRKLLANPADLRFTGVSSEADVLGKDDFELFPRDMAERFFEDDKKVIIGGESIMNRVECATDQRGSKRWMLASKVPLRDESGHTIGLVGNWTDITERVEIEEALKASEAEMRALFASMRDVVVVFDRNGRYLRIAQTNPELLYKPAPELIGKTVSEVLPPDKAQSFMSAITSALKTGGLQSIQYDLTINGKDMWFDANVTPLTENSVLWVARDVTEHKRAEEALKKSEETLERITNTIDDTIYSIDGTTGEFEYLSPVFEKKFGYSLSDIRQMGGRWSFIRTVVLNDEGSELDPIVNDMQTHQVDRTPVWDRWWKCKDGTLLFVEDHSVPTYVDGRLVRVDGVLRDITQRKLAEDAVQKEQILLRTLIDHLPHTIYVKDTNFRKLIANPADVRFSGRSSEADLIGKTDFEVYPPEIAEKFVSDDRQVIEKGIPVLDKEELLVTADGKERWLLTSKLPLHDASGQIIGLVGVGTDVTVRKSMEEALRRSEAELRALFESMNDVIMVIDSDGRYLKIAPTDPSLLYRPADAILGKTVFETLPRGQAELIFSTVRKTLLTGKTQSIEYSLPIGGEEKWRAANVSPMSENSVIWVARDVTQKKVMEKEITESEKKYRELVENALVGVYKINLSGTIVYANQSMAEMLEFESPSDMMSVRSSSLFKNPTDMADLVDELRVFGRTGSNREIELVTKSGKVRNVLISASIDRDVISGMAKDITEIRTLERQFIQTQKLEGLGNIAAGIAHDFNNILGVIVGYSDLLARSPFDHAKFERGIRAIAKASDRGKSLVGQLLTFARKTEVTFEPLELNDVVTEIQKLIEETFPRTVEIRTGLADRPPQVLADATQIHQVLLNLCVNARDAMPSGGAITIASNVISGSVLAVHHPSASAERYVEITVSDNGTGMDEDTRQRIFEPFFTTKGVGKGTGLGLSVVYGIVESHRGFIDVFSELGRGTTFEIYLPVLEHPADAVSLADEADDESDTRHGTILVIEDEEMLRDLLRSILTAKGYEIIFAKDGEEGLATYMENKDRIDLVISDLGLPKLNGDRMVEEIRKISGSVRIVIASGFVDPEVKTELESKGVSVFIQKPYKTNEVLHAVNELLRSR